MLQEQNQYQPEYKHKRPSPLILIDRIDSDNNKLKHLINSFRERGNRSDDSFNDSNHSKHEGVSSKSFGLQESRGIIRKQAIPFYDNNFSKTERNGDFVLPSRRHHNGLRKINIDINQQLISKRPLEVQPKKATFHSPSRETVSLPKKGQSQLLNLKQSRFRIKNSPHVSIQRQQKSYNQDFQVQSINTYLIASHLQTIPTLQFESNPQEIFTFFESIYQIAKFSPPASPVIKRYKNCIYYGDKPSESHPYKGMIWYFKKTLYYGEMLAGKKHGLGIEIKLADEVKVWKGKFQNGQKTGYFSIESSQIKYYGMLKNGEYHGEGHLISTNSEYKGTFCEGLKEGNGWQKFGNKSEYKGEYFNNKFDGNGELKAQNYYFKGLFKYGKPDGYGFQRTTQYEYLGNFVMGVKEGKGKIKTKDGTTLEGIFKDGLLLDQFQNSPKSSKHVVLQKNLSKELHALNEESEQGTIENMLNKFKEY